MGPGRFPAKIVQLLPIMDILGTGSEYDESRAQVRTRDSPIYLQLGVVRKSDSVYQLYEPEAPHQLKMNVLFFHGLQPEGTFNAHLTTWSCGNLSGDEIWPKSWLPRRFPNARIISLSYDACIQQTSTAGRMDIDMIAETLITELTWIPLGKVPVVLVGHSFGGLVIKQICIHGNRRSSLWETSTDTTHMAMVNFLNNIHGIFFYETPHHGMNVFHTQAVTHKASTSGPLLELVKELGTAPARLHNEFCELWTRKYPQWIIYGLGAAHALELDLASSQMERVAFEVSEGSSRFGENFITIESDHFSACKPIDEKSSSYQHLVKLIEEVEKYAASNRNREHSRSQHKNKQRDIARSGASSRPLLFAVSKETVKAYVRIPQIETQIQDALEDRAGPSVILLHGNPGTGKTTLARYIGVHYNSVHNSVVQPASANPLREGTKFMVFFLECGCGASVTAKQIELLQNLSPEVELDVSRHRKMKRSALIERRIQTLLQVQGEAILIILDDVWEFELLEAFLRLVDDKRSTHVKFLVTSRKSSLFKSAVKIETQPINRETAEKILASHAGLTNNQIPPSLQDVVQSLIEQAQFNPLALAMVGSRIMRNTDVSEWKEVESSYKIAMKEELEGEGSIASFTPVLGLQYGRAIGQTLLMTYRSLPMDSKHLLILIANCEGRSIPGYVVRMLNTRLRNSRGKGPGVFHDHVKSLIEHGTMLLSQNEFFLQYDPAAEATASVWKQGERYETFTLHDLQRDFLNAHPETKKDVEKVMSSFLNIKLTTSSGEIIEHEENGKVVLAVCALYLHKQFAKKATGYLGINEPDYTHFKTMQSAVGPLVFLMGQEHSEPNEVRGAKQVFMKAVCDGELDDDGLLCLLSSSKFGPTIATVLNNFSGTAKEWYRNLKAPVPRTVESLLKLLVIGRRSTSSTRSVALYNLRKLALEVNIDQILEYPGAIETLVNWLSLENTNSVLLENTVWVLANVAKFTEPESRRNIGQVSGLMSKLLTFFLEGSGSTEFQVAVAYALSALALTESDQIVEFPGAVEWMVHFLWPSTGKSILVLEHVARILTLVASRSTDMEGAKRIGEIPGSIPNLLTLFLQEEGSFTFREALVGLPLVLSTFPVYRHQIMEFSGAIEWLISSLSNGKSTLSQEQAALTLFHLAVDIDGGRKIVEVPGSTSKFLRLLSQEEVHLDVQEALACIFHALSINEETRDHIVKLSGALEELADLLFDGKSEKLRGKIASILGILALHPEANRRIGEIPGKIPQILSLFLRWEGSIEFQGQLGLALRVFAMDNANQQQFLKLPSALEELVHYFCAQRGYKSIEDNVVWILVYLALDTEGCRRIGEVSGSVSNILTLYLQQEGSTSIHQAMGFLLCHLVQSKVNRHQMLQYPEGLERLAASLWITDSYNRHLQSATFILCELASETEGSKRVGEVSGSIARLLTIFLRREGDFEVQQNVTRALRAVARSEANRLQMMEFPGAVEGLVSYLSGVVETSWISTCVAEVLSSLAGEKEFRNRLREIPEATTILITYSQLHDVIDNVEFQQVIKTLCD